MDAYDAVIVGARVAGASLALLLGRQGRRVLLVDRERFPSDTLSTHLLPPSTINLLMRLGVLHDVEALGLRRITRQRTYIGDCIFEGNMLAPPPAFALCARRDRLDSILIRHATSQPSVEFAEFTRADGLIWEAGRVAGLRLRSTGGAEREVRTRVVVGADGKNSKVAGWVQAARYNEVAAMRPLYFAYYRGVEPLAEPANEVFFQDGHIGYLFPMEPNMDLLVLELQPEEFATYRADPAGRFEAAFRILPGMRRRLESARREGQMHGIQGVENYFRTASGPGWVLTGDAAYCKDPSTALGIGDAFTQAFMLSEALDAVFSGADWEVTLTEYQRRRDERVMPAYQATLTFTRMGDLPAESLARLQAIMASPVFTHVLAEALSSTEAAHFALPAELSGPFERSFRAFLAGGSANTPRETVR